MPNKKKGKKLQKLLIRFARILGSLVLVSVILLLMPLSLPRLFGYETFNVVSESMEPTLPVGTLLLVKQIEPKEIQKDEIIVFYSNAVVVSHRVIENNVFEGKITTKGDANEDTDINPVSYNEVIGIVEHSIPVMGMLGEYFSSSSGKLLMGEMIVCSALLFIVSGKIKV